MAMDNEMKVTNLQELRQARKKAAHRKRRIIFNNDGNEPVHLKKATAKELLDCRTTPLLGSQVDSIFYCTWSAGFSFFTHNTKVGQVFDTTANPKHPDNKTGGFSMNKTAEFIKQGTDPLKIMVEFCKKHDIEIFWSFRMNDGHDAFWDYWWGPFLFPQLKKDHPEYLMGSETNRPKHDWRSAVDYGRQKIRGWWSAVDYGRQEIRDLAFRYIEEVCENYDVDGVELDFFRTPSLFKSQAMGRDVSQEERNMMTNMMRRIRNMTEKVGLKRGRPILVAVRVPDSVGCCSAIGLDIIRWLKENLIDILVKSGWCRLNPWETSVRLGHEHDVPVYACLSDTRIQDREAYKVRSSLACFRARAMNVWDSGADGVYMFNSFDPRGALWRELGDPKTLATLDKVYCTGARSALGIPPINEWLADGERFLNRSIVSPERPRALQPGKPESVELRVAEQIGKTTAKKLLPEVQLRLRVEKLPDPADFSVKLNGKQLSGGTKSGVWIDYLVDPVLITKGTNKFEIMLKPESPAKPTLQDLALWVRYKKSS